MLETERKALNRMDTMLAGLSGVSRTVPSAAYADAIAGSLLRLRQGKGQLGEGSGWSLAGGYHADRASFC